METWHTLTPPELILLQKHIELGKERLVTLLGKQGFQELLQLGKPKQGTLNELKEDNAEISGIALLTVNTILTGTFGGWMGFSAVMEFDLSSRWAFWMIFSLAILVGAAIGYQNFRFTKQAGERAVQTLKLLELKLDILEEIQVEHGTVEIRDREFFGLDMHRGYIITAQRPRTVASAQSA